MTSSRALVLLTLAAGLGSCGAPTAPDPAATARQAAAGVDTVVVIYAENRAFDTLYGLFPGANGIPGVNPSAVGRVEPQRDIDGAVLPVLPPAWGGLTAPGQPQVVTQAQSAGLPNRPFQIDAAGNGLDGHGIAVPVGITTRDLVHRFYSNIMQIDGGSNSRFAAYSDAGGLAMGYYDGSGMAMWKLARDYVLADNFYQGAFGGSFLNHQYLICACIPEYPNADAASSPARGLISAVELDGAGRPRLAPSASAPSTTLAGPPTYLRDSSLTPRDERGMFYAVNTMQPPYQPSSVQPPAGGDPRYGDPAQATTLPPQKLLTIGDTLDAKGVSWAWYGGAWGAALGAKGREVIYKRPLSFQTHHQPFNYYASVDPAAHADYRARHLKDFDADFLADAAAGKLPAVAFYKPQGNLNQHAGYANVADGDAHIAGVIAALQKSPQWPHMLIVVTYDENGGFWDHAPVPRGDRWGPGTRVPAIIVSPLAKRGFVDKTPYDTASILRFITRRFELQPLPGIALRDRSLQANGHPPMGDLTAALQAPSS